MAIRGRPRWKAVPALKQQFADGRDYISCPECKAFLGDNKPFRPVRNFARQHMDGREHLTCPKCHALLGRVYWEKATIGDRIRHACAFQISDMSWRARWVTSLVIAVGLVGGLFVIAFGGAHGYSPARCLNYIANNFNSFISGLAGLLGLGVLLFGFVWVFLSPGGGNYNYAWLWWFNNNRR